MLLKFNPKNQVVKSVFLSRVMKDKKTGEDRTLNYAQVNVLDDDGDIGTLRIYEPPKDWESSIVKGKPLPALEIVGVDFEQGVTIVSARIA